MASTVAQGFTEFEGKIALTPNQQQTVKARRITIQNILGELFPASSDMPISGAYVIGSAARSTMIRPIGDVDVFAIFDDRVVWDKYRSDSKKLLYRVRNALDAKYKTTVVGARGQAVRLFFKQMPHVDIAPAFPIYGTNSYYIPRGDGNWEQTAPFQHSDFLAQRNKDLSSQLKPLTRMLKRWNARHSSRIGSFHLELIAQATFSGLGSNRTKSVEKFFEWAPNHLDQSDPAGYSGNLAAGWSFAHRTNVRDSLASAHSRAVKANEAQSAVNLTEASRLWRIIFGEDFPSL